MAGPYFVDSFYWIALANPKDAFHGRALGWERSRFGAKLVTTEEVLAEVLTWFSGSGPNGRGMAVKTVREILNDATCQVLPQTSADFHAALALYEARPDKEYSLVDCRSINAIRALGISEVLTNDHHFEQEGFTIVFR
jgi:predicted nucleic acid-binding protein